MRRWGILAAVAALLLDQVTKSWALEVLWPPYSQGIFVLPVLNLRLGFNTGVTFGMFRESGAQAVWFMVALTLLISIWLMVWLWRSRSQVEVIGLGLVIGGALGNVLDRARQGAVTDFIDLHYGGWHWPTFNMADVAIVSGVSLLLLSSVRPARSAPPR